MTTNKYYIAGPMTGVPQFNYPLFDEVAKLLRDKGYDVTSPAEMDDPETRKAAMASKDGVLVDNMCNGETWGDFLARDVKMLADSLNGIVLLPNWEQSKGARLEAFVALTCGHDLNVYLEHEEDICGCTIGYVMKQIAKGVSKYG